LEAVQLSLKVIVPVFILIGVGFLLKSLKLFDNEALKKMIGLTFKVFLSVMIFNNLYNTTIEQALNVPVMLYAAGYVICIFIICMIVVPKIEKENPKRSSLVQGIFRSNNLMLGIPIITALCGPGNVGLMTMVVAVVVPLYNSLGVVTMEVFSPEKVQPKVILLNIIRNPFVAASILGIIALFTDLKLPYIIEKPMADVSGVAIPFALILLGGYIDFKSVKGSVRNIIIGVTGRLLIVPAVFIGLAVLLGFRNAELITLMGTIAAPTATASFIMAQQMGGDADLAAHIVVFSTLFSAGSMFLWIFLLKQFALF